MAFDFRKEYREYYMPKTKPEIVEVPAMKYIAVKGKGDPNEEDGEYKKAIGVLYAIAYTIKMSKKGDHRMEGYFDFVVPPLEGFWWQEDRTGIDYSRKDLFQWISVIRVPDFVTREEFDWAVSEAEGKKHLDCSKAELMEIEEGLCVQIMHEGSFDSEGESIRVMDGFATEQGYMTDFSDTRHHHEIYHSDARRVAPEKWKTVIRHPIRKV